MVYKRSEYGHQFKVSSLVKNVPVYKEHLSYRHLRREREYAHTPLSWDGETVESSESDERLSPVEEIEKISDLVINGDEKGTSIEEKGEMDDEKNEDDIEREKRLAQEKDECQQAKETENDVVVVKQSEVLRKSAKEKLNRYVCNVNKESSAPKGIGEKKVLGKTFLKPKQADDKVFAKRNRPQRPDRQAKVPRARPQSAPKTRPLAQGVETKEPFYNFGSGAQESCTGNKKTFNVRASSAVYPAALRAKKRNLLLIEKQLERQKTASAREKRRKAKFNERMARETAHWETEYHRCYPAYDNTEYATYERDPRKRKSFFLT